MKEKLELIGFIARTMGRTEFVPVERAPQNAIELFGWRPVFATPKREGEKDGRK